MMDHSVNRPLRVLFWSFLRENAPTLVWLFGRRMSQPRIADVGAFHCKNNYRLRHVMQAHLLQTTR